MEPATDYIVILTCPKAFKPPVDQLQRNALENWIRVGATPHLAGPEKDVKSLPEDINGEVTIVENSSGSSILPMFGDILSVVDKAGFPVLCYANADIIFPDVFRKFKSREGKIFYDETALPDVFLIVGSRWDFEEGVEYSSAEGDSCSDVADYLVRLQSRNEVLLHDPDAMDYFVFPLSLFEGLGPLIVGRGGYDNALVAYCLRRRIPVIDVSRDWPVLHQFHGYGHKKGGKKEVYLGDEAMMNRREHDIVHSPPKSMDADMILEDGKLIPALWRCGFLRRCELTLRFRWGLKYPGYLFRALQRIFHTQERITRREMAKTVQSVLDQSNA